jgi:hypothetical protein
MASVRTQKAFGVAGEFVAAFQLDGAGAFQARSAIVLTPPNSLFPRTTKIAKVLFSREFHGDESRPNREAGLAPVQLTSSGRESATLGVAAG